MKFTGVLKNWWSGKKNKKLIIILSIIAIVVVIGGILFVALWGQKGKFGGFSKQNREGNQWNGETITASGITTIGMLEETLELDNLENSLVIEEIYVSSGEDITEGSPILKLTDDSLTAVREELETLVKETELASRAGAIEFEQSKITAKYDYDVAVLEGTYAEAVYNEEVARLLTEVDAAEDALSNAQALIAEYTDALTNNTYYTEYKVEELKNRYDFNRALLTEKVEEWGVEWADVTGTGGSGMSMGGQGMSGNGGKDAEYSQRVSVLSQFYSVLENNEKEYLDALEKYESAMENASTQLQIQQLSLTTLKADYEQAKSDYAQKKLSAETEYRTTLAKGEQAQSDYETALTKAEETYNALVDEYEDAKEQLQIFEENVGDGIFYAHNEGSIVMSRYRAGDILQMSGTIIAYSNPEEVTISVSVDQSDIAKLSVGDKAYVSISGYDMFEGIIEQINPVSSSESRAAVTYTVTVILEGDVSTLSSNLTAQVTFQIGEEK